MNTNDSAGYRYKNQLLSMQGRVCCSVRNMSEGRAVSACIAAHVKASATS